MGKVIPIVVALVLLVYSVFDIWATPREKIQLLPKLVWLAAAVLLPIFGPLLWLFFGSARRGPARPPRRGYGTLGPDDDPDFLRGL